MLFVTAPPVDARLDVGTKRPAVVERIGFAGAPLGRPWPDGTAFGRWYSLHDGFGRTQVEATGSGRILTLTTKVPATDAETYSSLVRSRRTFGDVDFTVRLLTVVQLRRSANPWEVAWVLWRYTDNRHFYSFLVKPNGWELAKQDATYPSGQRFLAYSYAPSFPTGRTYRIRVRHVGDAITVLVDGVRIVRLTDRERPYRSGSIALYAEDSSARYGPVDLHSVSR